jgi:hypothetical protein
LLLLLLAAMLLLGASSVSVLLLLLVVLVLSSVRMGFGVGRIVAACLISSRPSSCRNGNGKKAASLSSLCVVMGKTRTKN